GSSARHRPFPRPARPRPPRPTGRHRAVERARGFPRRPLPAAARPRPGRAVAASAARPRPPDADRGLAGMTDAPRSRPLDELERASEPELPGVTMAAHSLDIAATRPAEAADVAGAPDPAL